MLKRSTFLAALTGAVVFSSSLLAGDVTKADRDMLVDHLKRTETSEHITKAEDLLRSTVEGMMKAPAAPDILAKTKGKEEVILKNIPDRTRKAQAPEPLVPKGTFATKAALIEAFKAARAKTLAIATGTSDLRAYGMAGFPIGEIDAYQGILFLSAHTERHTKQIEEVKATAGYPAK